MRATVPAAVPSRSVSTEDMGEFVNRELLQLLRQIRDALCFRGIERGTVATAGTGAYTRLWTSDTMPTTAAWMLHADIIGVTSTGSVAAAYHLEYAVKSATGTVTELPGGTTTIMEWEDAGACNARFGVDATARTAYLEVRDDAANAMKWTAVIRTTEVTPT